MVVMASTQQIIRDNLKSAQKMSAEKSKRQHLRPFNHLRHHHLEKARAQVCFPFFSILLSLPLSIIYLRTPMCNENENEMERERQCRHRALEWNTLGARGKAAKTAPETTSAEAKKTAHQLTFAAVIFFVQLFLSVENPLQQQHSKSRSQVQQTIFATANRWWWWWWQLQSRSHTHWLAGVMLYVSPANAFEI